MSNWYHFYKKAAGIKIKTYVAGPDSIYTPDDEHDAWLYNPKTNSLYYMYYGHHEDLMNKMDAGGIDAWASQFGSEDWIAGDVEYGNVNLYEDTEDNSALEKVIETVTDLYDEAREGKTASATSYYKYFWRPTDGFSLWQVDDPDGFPSHEDMMLGESDDEGYNEYEEWQVTDPYVAGWIHERPAEGIVLHQSVRENGATDDDEKSVRGYALDELGYSPEDVDERYSSTQFIFEDIPSGVDVYLPGGSADIASADYSVGDTIDVYMIRVDKPYRHTNLFLQILNHIRSLYPGKELRFDYVHNPQLKAIVERGRWAKTALNFDYIETPPKFFWDRLPFVYDKANDTLYLGDWGGVHEDLFKKLGLGHDHAQQLFSDQFAAGVVNIQGNISYFSRGSARNIMPTTEEEIDNALRDAAEQERQLHQEDDGEAET